MHNILLMLFNYLEKKYQTDSADLVRNEKKHIGPGILESKQIPLTLKQKIAQKKLNIKATDC